MDVTERALPHGTGGDKEHLEAARKEMAEPSHPGGKAVGTLAVLAVLYTLNVASAILLPFVLAIVLYLLLSPLMRILHRRLHLPRALGRFDADFGIVRAGGWGRRGDLSARQLLGRAGRQRHCQSWSRS